MHSYRAIVAATAARAAASATGAPHAAAVCAVRALHSAAAVAVAARPAFSHSSGSGSGSSAAWRSCGLTCSASSSFSLQSRSTLVSSRRSGCGAGSAPLLSEWRRNKSCGIIGLPNVGKSTLFNALTDTQLAEASNYPFCTIEPNVALVSVPDPLLVQLAALARTDKVLFNQMKFVDIAGIIKGASGGAGLGNKFLQNIKEADVLLHVVRCFEDPQVIHVDSQIDPLNDIDVIETELLLADLQTIDKRIENLDKAKNKTKEGGASSGVDKKVFYRKIRDALNAGVALVDVDWETEAEREELASMQLITAKPTAYVCNVDEKSTRAHNKFTTQVFAHVERLNAQAPTTLQPSGVRVKRVPRACLRVCSQLESEVQTFDTAESRKEFLEMNEMSETSLLPVIHTSNRLLQNICYYTVGEKEARAWGIQVGTNAQQAAGKIHTDLMKGFVCAEVIKPADFIKHGGDAGVREAGLMKVQGRDYIVQDGDIMVFRVQGQKGR